jgi:putative membrane protein
MIIKADLKYSARELLNRLWREIIFSLLFSSLVYYLYEHRELTFLSSFSVIPVSLLATMLSVFLAFRNNNAYGRWWEARQLWGDFINASRSLHLSLHTLVLPPCEPSATSLPDAQWQFLRRHVAYAHLLRMRLRGNYHWGEIGQYLSRAEQERIQSSHNPPSELLLLQGQQLKDWAHAGSLTDFRLVTLMQVLGRFYDVQGACERIKNTPFPHEYDVLIRILIWMLIISLPFYLLGLFADDEVSKVFIVPLTVISTLVVGFANKAGEVLEDPFENRVHDIPMTTLCQTIEKDLLGNSAAGLDSVLPCTRIVEAEPWVSW